MTRARWIAGSIAGTLADALTALADRVIGIPPGVTERHDIHRDD